MNRRFLRNLQSEVEILRRMNHEGIVKIVEVFSTEEDLWLVTELMHGGELFDYIVERNGLEEHECREITRQVLDAVRYLHANNIVHRDLKPENILLASKPSDGGALIVKLADFGVAKIIGTSQMATTYCGTPHYFAPEVHGRRGPQDRRSVGYDTAADNWSIGVILYIMLCGFPPFSEPDSDDEGGEDMVECITAGRYTFAPGTAWDAVSDSAKDLVRRLLEVDPTQRITASAALSHRWFSEDGGQSAADADAPNFGGQERSPKRARQKGQGVDKEAGFLYN